MRFGFFITFWRISELSFLWQYHQRHITSFYSLDLNFSTLDAYFVRTNVNSQIVKNIIIFNLLKKKNRRSFREQLCIKCKFWYIMEHCVDWNTSGKHYVDKIVLSCWHYIKFIAQTFFLIKTYQTQTILIT